MLASTRDASGNSKLNSFIPDRGQEAPSLARHFRIGKPAR
jgi:hypothetical protein